MYNATVATTADRTIMDATFGIVENIMDEETGGNSLRRYEVVVNHHGD